MKLADLYKKAVETDARTFEVVRSDGSMSGATITLKDPFGAEATQLGFMFDRLVGIRAAEFEKDNADLLKKCKKAKDFTEYNLGFDAYCQDLRDSFAADLVESWTFENEFTRDAVVEVIQAFRFPLVFSLERQIIDKFKSIIAEHAKK